MFILQKALFEQQNIDRPVRLVRVGHVLQDGDSLEELKIGEDDVISLVVEPEVEMKLKVELVHKTLDWTVANSARLSSVKKTLTELNHVAFLSEEFDLAMKTGAQEVPLKEDQPLHLCGAVEGSVLCVRKTNFFVQCVDANEQNIPQNVELSKTTEVSHLKNMIKKKWELSEEISLFALCRADYSKMSENATVHDQLNEDSRTVYFIQHGFLPTSWSVKLKESQQGVGVVYGAEGVDSALCMRLRVQDQLGVPAADVRVVVKVTKEPFSVATREEELSYVRRGAVRLPDGRFSYADGFELRVDKGVVLSSDSIYIV